MWWQRGGLIALCTFGPVLWAASRGRAELSAAAVDAGSRFFAVAESFGTGSHRVHVNGMVFDVASLHLPVAPDTLLDRLEARCGARDGGWGERFDELVKRDVPHASGTTLRLEHAGVGMVACLDLGSEDLSVATLVHRIERVGEDGDLRHLGAVRMARVEPASDGAHLVTVASRGPIRLDEAFPRKGDVPGEDPPDVPRPDNARRLLSGHVENQEPSISVYRANALDVPHWIDRWRKAGWSVEQIEGAESARGFWAVRAGRMLLATVDHGAADGAWLTLLDLSP